MESRIQQQLVKFGKKLNSNSKLWILYKKIYSSLDPKTGANFVGPIGHLS
jgi:hypothetical protein